MNKIDRRATLVPAVGAQVERGVGPRRWEHECAACGKAWQGGVPLLAQTDTGTVVWVGRDCADAIRAAGASGFQRAPHFARLYAWAPIACSTLCHPSEPCSVTGNGECIARPNVADNRLAAGESALIGGLGGC